MVYDNRHKMILQALMHEGTLEEKKAEELVFKVFNNRNINVIINQINVQLQPINMMIKGTQCEVTGELHWVLTSTILDDVTRFQEEFSKEQLAVLRNIFSELVTSNTGVKSTVCLNFCSSVGTKLTKAGVEEFLTDMVKRKWLAYENGSYYMGVRSKAELLPYFRATYENNLNTCCICKQVIFHGINCSNCENVIHGYCLEKCATIQTPVKCPGCNNGFLPSYTLGVPQNSSTSINEDMLDES